MWLAHKPNQADEPSTKLSNIYEAWNLEAEMSCNSFAWGPHSMIAA